MKLVNFIRFRLRPSERENRAIGLVNKLPLFAWRRQNGWAELEARSL